MSAAILQNPTKPTQLQDDLESFFYVLLYIAVRYMKHNFGNVSQFMNDYFDKVDHNPDGTVTGGNGKFSSIYLGSILFKEEVLVIHPKIPLGGHPLNAIIKKILTCLKAYYSVNNSQSTAPNLAEDEHFEAIQGVNMPDIHDLEFDESLTTDAQDPQIIPKVTDADKALAAQLESHQAFVQLVGAKVAEVFKGRWPAEDRTEDQLRPDYQPDKDRLFGDRAVYVTRSHHTGLAESANSTNSRSSLKRRREDTDQSETSREQVVALRRSRRVRDESPL